MKVGEARAHAREGQRSRRTRGPGEPSLARTFPIVRRHRLVLDRATKSPERQLSYMNALVAKLMDKNATTLYILNN
jgi:hypothetical protein